MTDPARPSEVQALAELVHDAYHDTKETGVTIVADLAAGIAARLHAYGVRVAPSPTERQCACPAWYHPERHDPGCPLAPFPTDGLFTADEWRRLTYDERMLILEARRD